MWVASLFMTKRKTGVDACKNQSYKISTSISLLSTNTGEHDETKNIMNEGGREIIDVGAYRGMRNENNRYRRRRCETAIAAAGRWLVTEVATNFENVE